MVPTVVFLKRKPDCTAPLVKGLGGSHSPSGEKFTILSLAHKVLSDHLQLLSSCCSPAHDSPTNPKSSSLPPLALCKCHSPCEECQCFLVHTANSLVRRGGRLWVPHSPDYDPTAEITAPFREASSPWSVSALPGGRGHAFLLPFPAPHRRT